MVRVGRMVVVSCALRLMISLRMVRVLFWTNGSMRCWCLINAAVILEKTNRVDFYYHSYFLKWDRFSATIAIVLLVVGNNVKNSSVDSY